MNSQITKVLCIIIDQLKDNDRLRFFDIPSELMDEQTCKDILSLGYKYSISFDDDLYCCVEIES